MWNWNKNLRCFRQYTPRLIEKETHDCDCALINDMRTDKDRTPDTTMLTRPRFRATLKGLSVKRVTRKGPFSNTSFLGHNLSILRHRARIQNYLMRWHVIYSHSTVETFIYLYKQTSISRTNHNRFFKTEYYWWNDFIFIIFRLPMFSNWQIDWWNGDNLWTIINFNKF